MKRRPSRYLERRFGIIPFGDGRVCWYATKNSAEAGRDSPGQAKQHLLRLFQGWHDPVAPSLWLTALHRAEWAQAIAQQDFRRELSAREANEIHRQLERDESNGIWMPAGKPENAFDSCEDLGLRHGLKLGVRTVDSLHVATALELKAERFWTFDDRQQKLAKIVGLRIL